MAIRFIYRVIRSRQSDRLCTVDRDWSLLYEAFDLRIFRISVRGARSLDGGKIASTIIACVLDDNI